MASVNGILLSSPHWKAMLGKCEKVVVYFDGPGDGKVPQRRARKCMAGIVPQKTLLSVTRTPDNVAAPTIAGKPIDFEKG